MKVSHIFNILREFPKIVLSKAFPSYSYKGVINAQIRVYNRLKKSALDMSENELLNSLIISRIETWPRAAPKEVEYAHYAPLLEYPHKGLEDVIWAIVEWECILSRQEYVFNRLSKMGLSPWEVSEEIRRFRLQVMGDIQESIQKKVKKTETSVVGRTWKPTAFGILTIISGCFAITFGGIEATISALLVRTGFPPSPVLGKSVGGIAISSILLIVLGIICLIGGIFALRRRFWRLAFVCLMSGAVSNVLLLGVPGGLWYMIPAAIFLERGKKEFGDSRRR